MKLLFVSGMHRSSTSEVARWLGSQPQTTRLHADKVAAESEGFLISEVFGFTPWRDHMGLFALRKANRMENVQCTQEDILKDWMPYVPRPNAEWLVEKSPVHIVQHKFLRRIFPDSYHLRCVRHPMAVAASLHRALNTAKHSTSWELIYANWLEGNQTFDADTADDPMTGTYYRGMFPHNLPIELSDTFKYREEVDMKHMNPKKTPKPPEDVIEYMEPYGFLPEAPWFTNS